MASLSAHLTAAEHHGRLGFHPDCPRCRSERLAGKLADGPLVSRRVPATLAAGLLALGAVAPSAALGAEGDQQQEGTAPPAATGGDPADNPDLDPGGDDTVLTTPTGPDTGPQAGGQDDNSDGAPVDTDPAQQTDQPLAGAEQPQPPASAPQLPVSQPPAPSPTQTGTPPPANAPAPAPATPPAHAPTQPGQATTPKAPATPSAHRRHTRQAKRHKQDAARGAAPQAAPAPAAPAQAPTTAVPTAPAPHVDHSPLRGRSYTVQPGDSLWAIAARVLDAGASNGRVAREVNRLWELNHDAIATGDPDLLKIGTRLRLR